MKIMEFDLEEAIFNASPEQLEEKGLYFNPYIKKRQLRIGNYGVADIVGISRPVVIKGNCIYPIMIEVIELKKDSLSISAFLQAIRYAKGITRFLEKNKNWEISFQFNINITLIGKEISLESDMVYLPDLLYKDVNSVSVNMFTYTHNINGFEFKEVSCYKLINEGFENE